MQLSCQDLCCSARVENKTSSPLEVLEAVTGRALAEVAQSRGCAQ